MNVRRPPSKRVRQTRAESKSQTRAALLDAAAVVFAREGYERASVDAIAAEAGYTVGALYSNFSGKRELFEEMFQVLSRRHLAVIENLGESPDVRLIARRLLQQTDEELGSWMLWLDCIVESHRNPDIGLSLAGDERRVRKAIAQVLPPTLSKADASTLAAAFQALWRGWLLTRAADPAGATPDRFAQALGWLGSGALAHARGSSPQQG